MIVFLRLFGCCRLAALISPPPSPGRPATDSAGAQPEGAESIRLFPWRHADCFAFFLHFVVYDTRCFAALVCMADQLPESTQPIHTNTLTLTSAL